MKGMCKLFYTSCQLGMFIKRVISKPLSWQKSILEDLFRTVRAVGLGAWRHRPPWNMYRFLTETCSCNAQNNAEKCRKRRFRASKFATFSLPPIMVGEVTRKLVNLIYTCPFFFTLTLFESWFVGPAFPEIFSKSFFSEYLAWFLWLKALRRWVYMFRKYKFMYRATFFWYGLHHTYLRTCLLRNFRPVFKDLL